MACIIRLRPHERVAVVSPTACANSAEDQISALAHLIYHLQAGDTVAAHRIRDLAWRLGLLTLAEIARQAAERLPDLPASQEAALRARLLRVGEMSILKAWALDDRQI